MRGRSPKRGTVFIVTGALVGYQRTLMNTEKNAEAFVQRLANDASLQEHFQNGAIDAVLEWAKSEGYEFTVTELQAALAATAPQGKELDEEQLGKVNGGVMKLFAGLLDIEGKGGALNY